MYIHVYDLYVNIHIGRQLVELQDDVTLREAIDTYERIVRKLLQEKKSVGMYRDQGWGKALSNSLSLKHKHLKLFKHKHKHKHYPGIHDLS